MGCISEIVHHALTSGHLSIEAENKLRQMLQTTHYSLEDMKAFVDLQIAALEGGIYQESREDYKKRRLLSIIKD
ncbi:MAG: hypothetical protein WBA13_04450 [Microcoleaceae cyanobacterium]